MTTNQIEAFQPSEQITPGDQTGQKILGELDMKAFQLPNNDNFGKNTGADLQLPGLTLAGIDKIDVNDLTRNVLDLSPHNPRAAEHVQQIQNAERHLPGLHRRSDAYAEGRTGMTDKDMEKLERENASGRLNPPLTREEQDALKFMRKNYEALKTGWNLFGVGREGITPGSFDRNKTNTDPVENQNPRQQQNPRDTQQPRAPQRTETQPARDFGDTKVIPTKGPWHTAEKMLEGQGLDHKSQQDMTKVLQGVWGGNPRAGKEVITEQNLEEVRRRVEATNNPKLKEWFDKRYPKA